MNRYFESLRPGDRAAIDSLPGGLVLVRVDRADYHWHPQKPYYVFRFLVLEPHHLSGYTASGRLYCTARAMWKLSWFLRDFSYDDDLLTKGEVDSRALVGLQGVVKLSYTVVRGMFVLSLDGFAPFDKWKELSPLSGDESPDSEVAS
jgi:hypothetical protein